ncbi:Zinc finger protein-likewith KRAB and SCAN domains 3 [Orchesella cincta]|uniref:Zinc finger protein-likewith KRAB and SCAN domains 3 n=1 Tax=Orchesella cincta TaxID=48709 RepID=A0A1D2MHC6_ORCCI|nr:Zinc finger protein-likewith KRAB and SCAN domains 3 [Orchesella cincta]
MSPRQDDISEETPPHREVGVSTQDAEPTITISPKEEVHDHDDDDSPVPNEKQNAMSQTLMRASRADDGHSSATTLTAEAPGPSLTPAVTPPTLKKAKSTKNSPLKKNLPSTSRNGALPAVGGDSLKRTRSSATSRCNMMPSIVLHPLDAELLMKMKKESLATAFQAEQDSYEWESDDEDLFTVTTKKKRQLFEGVEILRCVNPAKKEYLQCSVCSFTLQITKKYVKGNTPYQKMKAHINYCHKNNGVANMTEQPPAIFECDFCAETFATRESFREHQQLNPEHQIPAQECDICHRPLKFSSTCNTNLLRHKFSHKNDEERRAALEAGERGAYYAFLQKIDEKITLPNKKRRISHFSQKNKTARHVVTKKTVADNIKSRFGHFECHLCNRSFPLKNGLALHIKAHMKKINMEKSKLPSPPSSCTDVEVLKVKRIKKKNGKYESPPVLFPVSPQKKRKTIKTATQSSPKDTEPSKVVVRAEEDAENPEPTSTEMPQQQEADNDVVLPILKREVVEERIETDD